MREWPTRKTLFEKLHGCPTCGYSEGSKTVQSNWRRPTPEEAESEYKWEKRASERFFPSKEHFVKAVASSPIETISSEVHDNMSNTSDHATMSALRHATSQYHHPRDVERINKGFHEHEEMPAPIVLKHHLGTEPKYRVMSGNTRLNAAKIHGVERKAVVVDVTDHLRKTGDDFD